MASREELLQSIRPNMVLNKAFFLKVYGYEISFPGFADEAIKALNDAGCSRAREYYNKTVAEYQRKRDEELRPIARQIRRRWEAEFRELTKNGSRRT